MRFKLFSFVGEGTDTGFAVANPSDTEVSTVTARIFNTAGVFQREVQETYGPGEHKALFVTQEPLLVDADSLIEFTATEPVILLGLRSDNNLLASTAVIRPEGTQLAPGSVSSIHLAEASVGLSKLAPEVSFGRVEPPGDILSTSANIILGHASNSVSQGVSGATVGGGGDTGVPNTVSGDFATLGGGLSNVAGGFASTVGGGQENGSLGYWSSVGGGESVEALADYATAGGGESNSAAGVGSTVAGGQLNTASGSRSTVSGGLSNEASGVDAGVGGGYNNHARGDSSTVGGGNSNDADGRDATVGGGRGGVPRPEALPGNPVASFGS